MSQEDLLSLEDISQILNVSCDTVNSWVEQGILKPVRVGDSFKFRFEDVQALAQERLASSERSFRILIIDDDSLVGNSLKHLLEKSGYEVQVVSIGLAALDVASGADFDLILTDVRMPGMNGIETLKAIRDIRTQFGKPALPEIVITAYEDQEVREQAARMGVSEFILKPFEFNELITAIERNLQHAT